MDNLLGRCGQVGQAAGLGERIDGLFQLASLLKVVDDFVGHGWRLGTRD
jgi:hypothetical protein